jgi:hypothetical protein
LSAPSKDPSSPRSRAALLKCAESTKPPLERLRAWEELRAQLPYLSQKAADEARAQGYTWEEIGSVFGMTKQSAQERFGEKRKG